MSKTKYSTLKRWLINIRYKLFVLSTVFRKKQYDSKIFCIGFNKTGTTSFGLALKKLGYSHSSFNRVIWRDYQKKTRLHRIMRYTACFDCFDDLPWLKEDMIPVLDAAFPNSKFVYLYREEEAWKRSYARWHQQTFGSIPDADAKFNEYKEHERFVRKYFHEREGDFLELDISSPGAYKSLVDFLGVESSEAAFPHMNKS